MLPKIKENKKVDKDEVGKKLQALRTKKGISLRTLADLSGITSGALSHIENGRNSPSVGTLKKILTALNSTLGEFFASEKTPQSDLGFVIRAQNLTNIIPNAGIDYLCIPSKNKKRAIQLMRETYATGTKTGPGFLTHKGEECGFCITGAIELYVDGKRETLGPGDGYYFDSKLPHSFKNIGKSVAQIISACSPPSF